MTARILKAEAAARVREEALAALRALPRPPRVTAVHAPDAPAARAYRRSQERVCAEAGVAYGVREVGAGISTAEVVALVRELGADPSVAAITVHTPLPAGVDVQAVMAALPPEKDAEGIHPENLGRLAFGGHAPAPCAASAAVELARAARASFRGLEAVVVGRSALVGKAIALLLLQSRGDAPTVTICHTATADLGAQTRRADLLFAAAGRAGLVRGDMIKPGAVVVDVGINEGPGGRIVGDVAFEEALATAAAVTPVPGGVGPVCHWVFLRNVAACARKGAI